MAKSPFQRLKDNIRDVFDANTQADQQRRVAQGRPAQYSDDLAQRRSQFAQASNSAIKQMTNNRFGNYLTSGNAGTVRSVGGTLQSLSGLYDLVTPGKGTNRFSQGLERFNKGVDNFAQTNNLNKLQYKGGQFATDMATFAIPGAVVGKVGKVGEIGSKINQIPKVGRALPIVANVAGDLLQNASQRTAKGLDNNWGTLGMDTAFSLGTAGIVHGAPKVIAKTANAVNPALKAGTKKAVQIAKESTPNAIAHKNLLDNPNYSAINQHLGDLQKFHQNNTSRGLSDNHPTQIRIRQLMDKDLRDMAMMRQGITQGGYIKNPLTSNTSDVPYKSFKRKDGKTNITIDGKMQTVDEFTDALGNKKTRLKNTQGDTYSVDGWISDNSWNIKDGSAGEIKWLEKQIAEEKNPGRRQELARKRYELQKNVESNATKNPPAKDPLESLKQEARKYKSAEEFVANVHKQIENPANGKSFTALAKEYGLPTNEQKILNDVEALRWTKDNGINTYPEAARQLGVEKQYADITAKISRESDARYKNPYGNTGLMDETYTRQNLTDIYNQATKSPLANDAPRGKTATTIDNVKLPSGYHTVAYITKELKRQGITQKMLDDTQAIDMGTFDNSGKVETGSVLYFLKENSKPNEMFSPQVGKTPKTVETPTNQVIQTAPKDIPSLQKEILSVAQTSPTGSPQNLLVPKSAPSSQIQESIGATRSLPANSTPLNRQLQSGTINLTPSQAKNRFKAMNNRGNTFEVQNPIKGQRAFAVSPEGVVREGVDAGKIKVKFQGSKDGVPIKVTPFTPEDYAFGNWKDRPALLLNRETLDRNLDVVAGADAPKIKKFLVDASRNNETARANFVTAKRDEVKKLIVDDLGIKAGSKESALVQKYGEKLVDVGDLVREVGEVKAGKIMQASEYFRNEYDKALDMWNQERVKHGYDPVPKRADYFRHFQEINDSIGSLGMIMNSQNIPTEISGLTDMFKPNKPFSNAELQRKGKKTTYDAVLGFDNYLDSTSRQIFHMDTVQRGRAIEDMIRKSAVDNPEVDLPNFVANLGEWTNAVSGKKSKIDRAAEALVGRKVYGVADWLRRRTGANMVGANLSSAATNFIPFTQSLSTTSKQSAIHGMMDSLYHPLSGGKINEIDGLQSGFLTRRFQKEAIQNRGIKRATELTSLPFKIVDEFTSRSVVAGKYYEGVSKGLTPEVAMKQADDYASKVMADRSIGQTPNMFNSKTIGALTQFQLEVNNQVSFLKRDIPELANGNPAKIASALTQFVVFSYLFNSGYEKVMGRRPQIDPIQAGLTLAGQGEAQDMSMEERAKKASENITTGMPFVSTFTGGRLPVNAMMPKFGSIKSAINSYSEGDINKGNRQLYDGVSGPVFYGLPPFGGGQIKKTGEAINSAMKGYSETPSGNIRFKIDQNPVNVTKGALFGQYATDEGTKYVQSGFKQEGGTSDNLVTVGNKQVPAGDKTITITKNGEKVDITTLPPHDQFLETYKRFKDATNPTEQRIAGDIIQVQKESMSAEMNKILKNSGLPEVAPSLNVAEAYAKYAKSEAEGKISALERNSKLRSIVKDVYISSEPQQVRDLLGLSKDQLNVAIDNGLVTKDSLKRAMLVDEALNKLGLSSQHFSNKTRKELGFNTIDSGKGRSRKASKPKSFSTVGIVKAINATKQSSSIKINPKNILAKSKVQIKKTK